MEAVGQFDDQNADVFAGGDEKFDQVVLGGWEVSREIAHVFAGKAELGSAVDQKSDVLAEGSFDFGQSKGRVFDGVVQNAGNNGVFVHIPFFEDFLDGDGVNDVGFASLA